MKKASGTANQENADFAANSNAVEEKSHTRDTTNPELVLKNSNDQTSFKKKWPIDWNAVTALTSAIALIFLALAVFYNATEIRTARQIAQSQYLMNYYGEFQKYNEIQLKLVDGQWASRGSGPQTSEDWFLVARYMGLLEQIEVLIENDIMTLEVADRSYSHRIRAIYNNDAIRQRYLEQESFRWELFLKMVKRLEAMPVYQGLRKRDEGRRNSNPQIQN